jgi:hypothetical protein
MNLEHYEYKSKNDFRDFEFFSEGPNGRIKKIVQFKLEFTDGIPFYNISFGDWDNEVKAIEDHVVSNNGDRKKLLTTIALCIVEFSRHYPGSYMYFEGSTLSRTRLYQLEINQMWNNINPIFEVYGVKRNNSIEPFSKNVNYEAFWIRRKG